MDLEYFRRFLSVASQEEATRVLLTNGHGPANELALNYKNSMVDVGLAPSTVNRRLAALRSLVKLARTIGMVSWTLEVEGVKSQAYRDTRGPGREGFRKLLDSLDARVDAKAARDRAILHLLYDIALRRGEVVSLDLEHVDLKAGTVAVLGKGRTGREAITLPEPTAAALGAWIAVRGQEPGPLFLALDPSTKSAKRLSARSVHYLVRELGEDVGLKVWPHGLRHAAITQALDCTNGNVRAVQKFSRHKDVRVLTRYDDNRTDLGGVVARLVAAEAVQ
jgi:integrase/recombinase XerC